MDRSLIKLLYVEDNVYDYRLFLRSLNGYGEMFSVKWVDSVATAAKHLESERPDIILSDLGLRDSKGLTTIESLRALAADIPIVAFTGNSDPQLEQDVQLAGGQDYLVKWELRGRTLARTLINACRWHKKIEEVRALVSELEESRQLLQQQSELLQSQNGRLHELTRSAHELVDNVSHDFRTPLTVIKDFVEIIRSGMVGEINAEQCDLLDKVIVRADDLNNMVDDLLDVSKMRSGLLGAWRRPMAPNEILQRAEPLLRQRAQVKNVDLHVDLDPQLPTVFCDAEKAGRVLTNLAVNAIKFCGKGGEVRVSASADPENGLVRIGVTDNGPGIDPQSLQKIFARFEQTQDGVATGEGFGLGLSIAQQFCRLNLGDLNVESEVGRGSTFSFTLPTIDIPRLVSRWLDLQEYTAQNLRVFHIQIEPEAADVTVDDFDNFDGFLNYLTGEHDLLLRINGRSWVLITCDSDGMESVDWPTRVEQEFHHQNRNRPTGPLPDFRMELRVEGSDCDSPGSIFEVIKTVVGESMDMVCS